MELCALSLERMKVDILKMRERSKKDESGRSSKVCWSLERIKVDGLRMHGRPKVDESGRFVKNVDG